MNLNTNIVALVGKANKQNRYDYSSYVAKTPQ
jgi:hypothetical protein